MWLSTTRFLDRDFSVVFDDSVIIFSGFFAERDIPQQLQNISLSQMGPEVSEQVILSYRVDALALLPLPLAQQEGTVFQQKVWSQLLKIPRGKVITYADLAMSIGGKSAVRAIGNACGRNPFSLILPCHRVVAKTSLGGYRWGVNLKKALIMDEQADNSVAKLKHLTAK